MEEPSAKAAATSRVVAQSVERGDRLGALNALKDGGISAVSDRQNVVSQLQREHQESGSINEEILASTIVALLPGGAAQDDEDATPNWLTAAVDTLAATIVSERLSSCTNDKQEAAASPNARGGVVVVNDGAAVRDGSQGEGRRSEGSTRRRRERQRWGRLWFLPFRAALVLALVPIILAISIALAQLLYEKLAPDLTGRSADSGALPSSQLVVPGALPGSADQLASALGSLGGTLRDAMQRGDGAVLAASREAAAREAAQNKVAELQLLVTTLRRDLATARSSLKEHAGALRAKEEALSRLEDLHSHTSAQLERDAKCCREESRAHGQAREAQKQAEGKLYRCEQQLKRSTEKAAQLAAKRKDESFVKSRSR